MTQEVLPGLLERAGFGAWLPVKAAAEAVEALQGAAPVVCLYGPSGSGKSHLLALAATRGMRVADNLEALGQAEQVALFHALQQAQQGLVRVVVASQHPVAQLGNLLPDVKSRLLLAPQIELGLPDDRELRALLAHWAVQRQLNLPAGVMDYLLTRAERNPATLAGLVVKLDSLSLVQKRAITVPLARQVLGQLADL